MGVAVATEEVSPREVMEAGAKAEAVAARARTERASFMVAFDGGRKCCLRTSELKKGASLSRVGHECESSSIWSVRPSPARRPRNRKFVAVRSERLEESTSISQGIISLVLSAAKIRQRSIQPHNRKLFLAVSVCADTSAVQ